MLRLTFGIEFEFWEGLMVYSFANPVYTEFVFIDSFNTNTLQEDATNCIEY